MATLIYVHGTGVRGAGYTNSLDVITEKARTYGGHDVVGVPWGDSVGVKLLKGGASIPDYRRTGGTSEPTENPSEAQQMADIWQMLLDDPLAELRLLGAGPAPRAILGERPPGEVLAEKVDQLGSSIPLSGLLASSGLERELAEAKQRVVESQAYQDALRTADSKTKVHEQAVVRAIVAAMEPSDGDVLDFIAIRETLVAQLGAELGATGLGVPSRFLKTFLKSANWYVRRRRGKASDAASAKAGDILNYTLAGDQARAMIEETVLEVPRPVHLLGHSLGGIMCFDLLCMGGVAVDGLITVGSQAPFMYEVSSLRGLTHPKPLPDGFPPWLNVYDKRDLLSYLAEPIFGPPARDFEAKSGEPFPYSHNAYWTLELMWLELADFLR